jgi:hypothetical protein
MSVPMSIAFDRGHTSADIATFQSATRSHLQCALVIAEVQEFFPIRRLPGPLPFNLRTQRKPIAEAPACHYQVTPPVVDALPPSPPDAIDQSMRRRDAAVSGAALTLSDLGRGLPGRISIKHNIKRIDRLLGNQALHREMPQVHEALVQKHPWTHPQS